MGRWSDIATWRGPSPNQGGAMTAHRGVVLHIAEGSYLGTVSWCLNPRAEVSAHFVVAKDGSVSQLVDTATQSWCQVAGNSEWLSIENEGHAGDSLTSQQVEACSRILARAHREYGIPLKIANSPSDRGLGHHGMGGAAWGGHTGCPGNRIIAQKSEIIRLAGGVATEGDDELSGLAGRIVEAWSVGNLATSDGHKLAPVEWELRNERFRADAIQRIQGLEEQLADTRRAVEEIKASITSPPSVDCERLAAELIRQMMNGG